MDVPDVSGRLALLAFSATRVAPIRALQLCVPATQGAGHSSDTFLTASTFSWLLRSRLRLCPALPTVRRFAPVVPSPGRSRTWDRERRCSRYRAEPPCNPRAELR